MASESYLEVFLACANGNLQVVKDHLSKAACDDLQTITDQEGDTLLHLSSRHGQLNIVKFLVEEMNFNCQLRDEGEVGLTAVHRATSNKSFSVLQYFIEECGCDPACQGRDGSTLLHTACQQQEDNSNVVRYLTEKHRVSPSCVNNEGNTPLHEAAEFGNITAVEYLCELKNPPDVTYRNRNGDSALDLAASNGHLKVVKYFTNVRKTDFQGESGCTPLHKACETGQLAIVLYFLNDFGMDAHQPDEEGRTPLHYAAISGNLDLIQFLIDEKKSNIYHQNLQGHSVVHLAASGGNLDVVRYFIEVKKCNPSSAGKEGFTPLHAACENGHLNVAKYLLREAKVDLFYKDREGISSIDFAAHSGNLDMVRFLAEDEKYFSYKNTESNEALLVASLQGHCDVVEYLVRNGYCNPHLSGNLGRTPLHAACDGENFDIVNFLVHECNVSCSAVDDNGDSPLHYAACHGNLDIARLLLDQPSCDMYHHNKNASTPLHDAAYHGYLEIVKYLISVKHCDPNCRKIGPAWTPLHAASQEGHLDIVMFLVGQKGVDPLCEDDEGITPLDAALAQNHHDVMHYLRKSISRKQAVAVHMHNSDSHHSGSTSDNMQALTFKRAHATGIVLGKGSFGTVMEVMIGQTVYAAKEFHTVTDTFVKKLTQEANVLTYLKHRNIVRYYGLCCRSGSTVPLLLMERMVVSLQDYILERSSNTIPLPKKVFFLCDIACGLSYLHAQNPVIIHRDLTAKNILLDSSLTAKIADFGNSRILDMDTDITPEGMTTQPGTLDYMPPEAFGETPTYNVALDVFSFGHLALVVTAQKSLRLPTLRNASSLNICTELARRNGYFELLNSLMSNTHPLLPIIRKCLSDDPENRPTACQLDSELLHIAGPDYNRKNTQRILKDGISLKELQLTKTPQGKRVEIIKSLAPKWKEFGLLLDFDPTGNELDIIDRDHRGEGCIECCTSMFSLWLQGRGRQPAIWETLLDLLENFHRRSLVQQIRTAIGV